MSSSPNLIRADHHTGGIPTWHPASFDSDDQQPTTQIHRQETSQRPAAAVAAIESPFQEQEQPPAFSGDNSDQSQQARLLAVLFHDGNCVLRDQVAQKLLSSWKPQEIIPIQSKTTKKTVEEIDLDAIARQAAEQAQEIVDAARKEAQGIIDQALLQAKQESDQILAQAQLQASAIIDQTQANAEEITRQAHMQGLTAGHAEVTQVLAMAQSIVNETRNWRENLLTQSEPIVINLIRSIAQKMFGSGLVMETSALSKTFELAVSEAKTLGDLRIRAHPEDIATLGPLWPTQHTAMTGQKIEMIPDQDVQRGGCYLDGQFGSVDARVDTQLHMITETLEETLEAGSRSSDPFIVYDAHSDQEGE